MTGAMQSLKMLRSHNEELETVESDLLCSEAQVKELEKSSELINTMNIFPSPSSKRCSSSYDELERQLQHRTEENATLKGTAR